MGRRDNSTPFFTPGWGNKRGGFSYGDRSVRSHTFVPFGHKKGIGKKKKEKPPLLKKGGGTKVWLLTLLYASLSHFRYTCLTFPLVSLFKTKGNKKKKRRQAAQISKVVWLLSLFLPQGGAIRGGAG